ncbi:MAG: hypothetical protein Q7T96_08410 [Methylobacter sp.]|uniref:hypothetical protein n=1 Tax=Methylobacter sp. TaxID=2051955 RepID=UPI0027233008|nr:hypothetical protein [Methylobacter sp.]MDO9269118.1 hypothetical protein [Methylobacter sp.]MDP1665574.1 hypothetical protein [Methylobacter sp.]
MSEKDQQETLLMAIEYLKTQYESLQNPCIALLISRYYRLLANLNVTKTKQEKYAKYSKSWLICHINNPRHSQKMQHQLNDFIQPYEFNL